jgi:mycofactocin precursor
MSSEIPGGEAVTVADDLAETGGLAETGDLAETGGPAETGDPEDTGDLLVEEISIDGMCGVY